MGGVVGTLEDPTAVGQAMAKALEHRGPDALGAAELRTPGGTSRGVFAHARLAIIDLTEGGAQPMVSADGGLTLAFNGEIYNFRELRASLERRGHTFRSTSDTEVILAQYLEYGEEGLNALDGMFAFGLWDQREDTLILARDRVGKKPLYWTVLSNGSLAFASEAKALRCVPGLSLELDPHRIPEYLTFGYVGTPRSMYRQVHRLEPGSRMRFRVGQPPRVTRYWSPYDLAKQPLRVDEREAMALVRGAVGRAVERRMVSDVPIGTFLSGGVDSSIVTLEMAARAPGKVRTFAVGFEDDASFDETRYAREVAEQLGTDHTELRLTPDARDMFDELLYHHDEPYGDSSALAVHAVSAATRRHVTVVLTGDGGDEVFAGYTRFKGGLLQSRLPTMGARLARAALERVPQPRGYKNPLALAQRFVEHAGRSADEQLLAWNAYFVGPRLKSLLRPSVFGEGFDPWSPMRPQLDILARAERTGWDRLGQILVHNLETYLLDDLLVKTDRMTMSVGLEARSPFLDTELIELAFRLPSDLKMKGGALKWLLKEAYRGPLGPNVLDRQKHGFGVPVGRWWSGPLRPWLSELFGPEARVRTWLDGAAVERLLAEHLEGHRDHGQRIFALVQLELFVRQLEG